MNGEFGYRIEMSLNSNAGWTEIGDNGADNTNFSVTGLSDGTVYFFRVRGYSAAGFGDYSPVCSGFTFVAAPGSLSSVGGVQKITLNWSDVTGEFGYEIERSPNGIDNWTQLGSVSSDTLSYIDSGLAPSTTYYYRVRAYNPAGYGEFSPVSGATTSKFSVEVPSTDPTPPPAPIVLNPLPLPAPDAPHDREPVSPSKPTPSTPTRRVLLRIGDPVFIDTFEDLIP